MLMIITGKGMFELQRMNSSTQRGILYVSLFIWIRFVFNLHGLDDLWFEFCAFY